MSASKPRRTARSSGLSAEGVVGGYRRGVPIVRGVDLACAAGTITTLVGPNGAGKSSLLRALFGQLPHLRGTVRVGDVEVTRSTPPQRMRAGIGFCPQGRCNFPRLTVADNLRLAGYLLDSSARRRRLIEVREEFSQIADWWKTQVADLSGGQQQLVELVMAVVNQPTVLLVDEPSLGLSPQMQTEIFQLVRALSNSGVCVLMVEQNVKAALQVTDSVVLMDQGRTVLVGPPDEVISDERMRAVYVGATTRAGVRRLPNHTRDTVARGEE